MVDHVFQYSVINNFNKFGEMAKFLGYQFEALDKEGICHGLSMMSCHYAEQGRLNEFFDYLELMAKHGKNTTDFLKRAAISADQAQQGVRYNDFTIQLDRERSFKFSALVDFIESAKKCMSGFTSKIAKGRFAQTAEQWSKGKFEGIGATTAKTYSMFGDSAMLAKYFHAINMEQESPILISSRHHTMALHRDDVKGGFRLYDPNKVFKPKHLTTLEDVAADIVLAFRKSMDTSISTGRVAITINIPQFGHCESNFTRSLNACDISIVEDLGTTIENKELFSAVITTINHLKKTANDPIALATDLVTFLEPLVDVNDKPMPRDVFRVYKAAKDLIQQGPLEKFIEKTIEINHSNRAIQLINSYLNQYHHGHLSRLDFAVNVAAIYDNELQDQRDYAPDIQQQLAELKHGIDVLLQSNISSLELLDLAAKKDERLLIDSDHKKSSWLTMAADYVDQVEVIKKIIDKLSNQPLNTHSKELRDLMLDSLHRGNIALVDYLDKMGVKPTQAGEHWIHYAIMYGNFDPVRLWPEKIKLKTVISGKTVLEYAAEYGDANFIQWLADRGYDISNPAILDIALEHDRYDAALTIAMNMTPVDTKQLQQIFKAKPPGYLKLIETRSDISASQMIEAALRAGNDEVFSELLARGFDINNPIADANSVLEYALRYPGEHPLLDTTVVTHAEQLSRMIVANIDDNFSIQQRFDLMTKAIRSHNHIICQALLKDLSQEDIQSLMTLQDAHGNTLLVHSIHIPDQDVFNVMSRALSRLSEDQRNHVVNFKNKYDQSVLFRAVNMTRCNPKAIDFLLNQGIELAYDSAAGNLLYLAAKQNKLDILQRFLSAYPETNKLSLAEGLFESTPNQQNIFHALAQLDSEAVHRNGATMLHQIFQEIVTTADASKQEMTIKALINQADGQGYTPLMLAAERGNILMIKELLASGAAYSITAKNHHDEDAPTIALRSGKHRAFDELTPFLASERNSANTTSYLVTAAKRGDYQTIKRLCDAGYDPLERLSSDGHHPPNSALEQALAANNYHAVVACLESLPYRALSSQPELHQRLLDKQTELINAFKQEITQAVKSVYRPDADRQQIRQFKKRLHDIKSHRTALCRVIKNPGINPSLRTPKAFREAMGEIKKTQQELGQTSRHNRSILRPR